MAGVYGLSYFEGHLVLRLIAAGLFGFVLYVAALLAYFVAVTAVVYLLGRRVKKDDFPEFIPHMAATALLVVAVWIFGLHAKEDKIRRVAECVAAEPDDGARTRLDPKAAANLVRLCARMEEHWSDLDR
jgi:hypothetical protein